MRKMIGIMMMICLGVLFYFHVGKKIENQSQPISKFEQLMEYNLDQDYPSTPEEVISLYQKWMEYLYGGTIQKQEIEPLIIQMRKLFHHDLLEMNEKEMQMTKVEAEIESTKETNIKILGAKVGKAEYLGLQQDKAKVKVIQILNSPEQRYIEYYLMKENEKWKILGWKNINKFILPEE